MKLRRRSTELGKLWSGPDRLGFLSDHFFDLAKTIVCPFLVVNHMHKLCRRMALITKPISISKAIERMLLKAYKAARHQNKISDRSNFDCRADTLCLNDFMAQNGLNQSPDITLSDGQGSPAGIHRLFLRDQRLLKQILDPL